MKIGIDASPVANLSGTGYYTQKLIEFLGRADGENEYVLFCPSDYLDHLEHARMFDYPNFQVVTVPAKGQAALSAWKQFVLPRQVRKFGINLFHYPSFIASLRSDVPSVLTVHDFCFSLFPGAFPILRRPYYRYFIPRSIGHCDAIIVDSDSTRADILRRTGDKINVQTIHLGVDPVYFYQVTNESERTRLRRFYSLPEQFILYVGTLEPRKNIPSLIRAYAYGIVSKGLPHHLVIAGRKGWLFHGIFREVQALNLEGRVHFPGYIKSSDLGGLYSMARAFAYPSIYEGFGLPCLEAMSCGIPVIASDRSSLPEIVGDCALTVDPMSVDSIANALRKICSDDETHRKLSEAGLRRASRFSWLNTAKKTLEVYTRTCRET